MGITYICVPDFKVNVAVAQMITGKVELPGGLSPGCGNLFMGGNNFYLKPIITAYHVSVSQNFSPVKKKAGLIFVVQYHPLAAFDSFFPGQRSSCCLGRCLLGFMG
jgi:hypothetical protein